MAAHAVIDRGDIHREFERASADFHQLLAAASPEDLRRAADGPRWTNQELLWHMAFGFLVVRRLLPLVRLCGRLPPAACRRFAALLQAGTPVFDWVNGAGPRGGSRLVRGDRLVRQLDHSIARLHRSLDAESEAAMRATMPFPTRWEPLFEQRMSLEAVYRYASRQYDAHRAQLTLSR